MAICTPTEAALSKSYKYQMGHVELCCFMDNRALVQTCAKHSNLTMRNWSTEYLG